jgi:tetratricopeptide (TPR) repeat protein
MLEGMSEHEEAELSWYRTISKRFETRGGVADRLEAQRSLGNLLYASGRGEGAVTLLVSTIAGYNELGLKHRVISVMGTLLQVYYKLNRLYDLTALILEMEKVLNEGLEMNSEHLPEFLINGIQLASTYSKLKEFASAQAVFSCVLPKLELLGDTEHGLKKVYGYQKFGLHWVRRKHWVDAVDYLLRAYEGLLDLDKEDHSMAIAVKMTLIGVMETPFLDASVSRSFYLGVC